MEIMNESFPLYFVELELGWGGGGEGEGEGEGGGGGVGGGGGRDKFPDESRTGSSQIESKPVASFDARCRRPKQTKIAC